MNYEKLALAILVGAATFYCGKCALAIIETI